MLTFLAENLWEIFFGLLSAGALGFCKYLWSRTKKLEEMQRADQNRQTREMILDEIEPIIAEISLLHSQIDPYSASIVIDSLFPVNQDNRNYGRSLAAIVTTIKLLTYDESVNVKLELTCQCKKEIKELISIHETPLMKSLKEYVHFNIFKKMEDSSEAINEFNSYIDMYKEKINQPLPKFK